MALLEVSNCITGKAAAVFVYIEPTLYDLLLLSPQLGVIRHNECKVKESSSLIMLTHLSKAALLGAANLTNNFESLDLMVVAA